MHAGFVSATDATASAAASGSTGAGVGMETTTPLRFGWGTCQKWQGPGLLPSFLKVYWPQIQAISDDAMAILAGDIVMCTSQFFFVMCVVFPACIKA